VLAALLQMPAFGQTYPATQNVPTPAATLPLPAVQAITVREFRFTGNTVFTSTELKALVSDYVGRELTFEQLDDARRKVTQHYVDKGYITSGAILPEQTITDGVMWIHVVEGRLERLDISGNRGLSSSYFTDRLAPSLRPPLQVNALKDAMELLQQDPRLAALQGRLLPGREPGLAVFDLHVQEARPYQVGLQFDNAGTPSTGAERLALVASHLNLTGVGDTISLRYGPMTGGLSNAEFAPSNDIFVQYSRPIIGDRTRVILFFARNDLSLVEPPLSVLGSDTVTNSFAVSLQQTLLRTPKDELNLTLALSRRDNQTRLLGQGFSFSDGAVNGYMAATALRTSLDWTTRSDVYVISVRSTLSIGLDALGATVHQDTQPDSRFVSWLGELQQAWRIQPLECTLLSRASIQVADQRLLALEQFSMGGMNTVRGYRENDVLTDNAALFSLELRKNLLPSWRGFAVDGALFADVGYGWDHGRSSGSKTLASVGCGLLFDVMPHVQGEIFYGLPLCNHTNGDNLQDLGIHFQLLIKAF
jgi:hemolysin activation/secretion protein